MAAMLQERAAGPGRRHGFTLIESLLSLVLLTLAAAIVGSIYFSGLQTLQVQSESILASSALRSKMEYLLSLQFDQLETGSQDITLGGKTQTLAWTVAFLDMDGDGELDETAKQITLTLSGKTLVTLVVDTAGMVSKVS